MVRGDEYLRFTDEEIAGENPAAFPVNLRRHAADHYPRHDPAAVGFGLILLGLLASGPLVIAFHEYSRQHRAPTPATYVQAEQQSSETGTAPRDSGQGPATHVWYLTGFNGQTYPIEYRPGGGLPTAPPGLRAAYAASEITLHNDPGGIIVARLSPGTPLLHSLLIYREPCWNWIITADGTRRGYGCVARPEAPATPEAPAPPASQPTDWMHVAHFFESEGLPQPLGFVPREHGCADVAGVMRRVTGWVEPEGMYELPLCEERTLPGRVYRFDELTAPPRLLYKVDAEYTDEARVAILQGTVVLDVLIDERGRAADFRVIRSLGLGLDEKAIESIRQWRFQPALRGETPVRTWGTVEVNYRLL